MLKYLEKFLLLFIGRNFFITELSQAINIGELKLNVKESVRKEAKRIEEDSLYSARGPFAASGRWSGVHIWLGIPAVALAAIAGFWALSRFDNSGTIAGFLAITVAALTAIATLLNPSERANVHLNAGNAYLELRNEARIFSEITTYQNKSGDEITEFLHKLEMRRNEINQSSPHIPTWAYERAKKGIEQGEAKYLVDESP
jgi:hypothetical protein